MNIDRNNYEEYFLLFADNELTDSEKVEVIMFLKNNKDLEEEFNMINYTVSRPDVNMRLTDKSFLFRNNTASLINEKNYKEVFVLYHDNELTENEKQETEEFLSVHKELKNEFELIGLAILTPESSVVFPNKKILYKKEKDGKVIPLIFWKAIAAAAFIGFGLWIAEMYFNNKNEIPTVVVHSVPEKKTIHVPEKKENTTAQSSTQNFQPIQSAITHNKKIKKLLSNKNLDNGIAKTSIKNIKTAEGKVSLEKENDNVAITKNKIKNIHAEQIKTDEKISSQNQLVQNVIQKTDEASYVKNASYVQDANTNNDNYVFYNITTDEFKKTKVGGFLKKVKRIIERNNPISRLISGDDRQVVSK